MAKTRILVVEDSLTVRKRLLEVLSAQPDFEVVGEAGDGKTAIELCRQLKPDVVTLDMILPVMTGLAATEYIMAYCPTPILIVSSSTNRGELFKTYEALAAGALDVLEKPRGDEIDDSWERKLVSSIRVVSRVKVITHPRARLNLPGRASRSDPPPSSSGDSATGVRCVAIGASTGGPAALAQLLGALPGDFALPILVVIHIGAPFASALAEWLDDQSQLSVQNAVHGEALPKLGSGRVLMAPPERHMIVNNERIELVTTPPRHSCRPSVDVLFESLSRELGSRVAACLLTGMGRDGAEGLLSLRRAGATTMAQDEQSSVVFGMPREAAALGAAQRVLKLQEFAPALLSIGSEVAVRSVRPR